MRKFSILALMVGCLTLSACSKTPEVIESASDESIETQDLGAVADETQESSTEAIAESQISNEILNAKFKGGRVINASDGSKYTLNISDNYSVTDVNTTDENGVETVAYMESAGDNGYKYIITFYEVPAGKESFFKENPLNITSSIEQAQELAKLLRVSNKEIDLDTKVLDNNNEEHDVKRYEITLDMSILKIDNLGLVRETPTFYVVNNGENYLAILINKVADDSEEATTDETASTEETIAETAEAIEETAESTEESIEETADTSKLDESVKLKKDLQKDKVNISEIDEKINDTLTKNSEAVEESKEVKQAGEEKYAEQSGEMQQYIDKFKEEFMKQDINNILESSRLSCKEVDDIAEKLLGNILIGELE